MNNKTIITIGKFERHERTANSEAMVQVDGKPAGWITGVCIDVGGSILTPRFVIAEYDVYVDVAGITHDASFKTRGEATAFVRSLAKRA
jgi:hypothetical protein